MTINALEMRYHASYHHIRDVLIRRGVYRPKGGGGKPRLAQPADPWVYLALAIIARACRDWQRGRYLYREEVLDYFASSAFIADCDLAGLDADYVRERNRIKG